MRQTDLFGDEGMRAEGGFGGALFSACERYRYVLSRCWDDRKPTCMFLMLNPSTADALKLDPTVRRCVGFAKRWGFGSLFVGNIFAWRSTDPAELGHVQDPVGPDNDAAIRWMADGSSRIVCGWGTASKLVTARRQDIRSVLAGRELLALAMTANGEPGHPLYLRATLEPMPFFV